MFLWKSEGGTMNKSKEEQIKNKINEIVNFGIDSNKKSDEYKESMTLMINYLHDSIHNKLGDVNIKSEPSIKTVDYFIEGGDTSSKKYTREVENNYKQTVVIYNDKKSIPLFTWEITGNDGVRINEDNAFTFCTTDDEILLSLQRIVTSNNKFWSAVNTLKKQEDDNNALIASE